MSEANSMDCRVGPRAWVIFADNNNCRMWTTFQPHIQKAADAEGLTVTLLFDQTAIDAAVAAERERWQEHAAKTLAGIDEQETACEHGWWETSVGAAFGASKLRELLAGPNTPAETRQTAQKETP